MSASKPNMEDVWLDPADDAPELTDELMDIAEYAIGGKVIRPATGYLGPHGVVRGRPPSRDRAKQQVTLRLDADISNASARTDRGGRAGSTRRCGRRLGCS